MKIFASLREDSQQGWVWFKNDTKSFRSVIKIKNLENGKSIYCEALQIESNFLHIYNQPPRITISDPKNSIVMNGWYRDKLGLKTQVDIPLNIKDMDNPWGKFKACTDHPQIVVRLATWLGVLGLILGILGLLPTICDLFFKVFNVC